VFGWNEEMKQTEIDIAKATRSNLAAYAVFITDAEILIVHGQ
jgi:hypothetical protein